MSSGSSGGWSSLELRGKRRPGVLRQEPYPVGLHSLESSLLSECICSVLCGHTDILDNSHTGPYLMFK